MKIGVNIGHIGTQGAIGFLNETKCNTEIVSKLIPMLKAAGHTVIECSVPAAGGVKDFVMSTNFANGQKLDLLISVHCNSAASSSANGTEVLYPAKRDSKLAKEVSARIAKKLGTRDRGPKATGSSVYLVDKSASNCILIEGFFVSNKEDCEKYNPVLIAEGIAEQFGYHAGQIQNGNEELDMPEYLARKYQYCDDNIPLGLKSELQEAIDMKIVSYGSDGFDPMLSEDNIRTLVWIKRGR